ncbi:hypothetical protein [Rubritalea tangerina]|uniref:hypothetical protein n=1 Tax=Rubritalea tangerina TaxID=430798 RepID=UPI00360B89F2
MRFLAMLLRIAEPSGVMHAVAFKPWSLRCCGGVLIPPRREGGCGLKKTLSVRKAF